MAAEYRNKSRKRRRTVMGAALLLAVILVLLLAGCGQEESGDVPTETTNITMWLYPIGDFGNPDTVERFVASFEEKNPDIHVSVEYLDYDTGDDEISAALASGTQPDIVMEGPERIVTNWGAKGDMVDLSDLWTEEAAADITAESTMVSDACKNRAGIYYEYPLCRAAHCMAINYELFQKAGALSDLDLTNRTWTTEGFMDACKKLKQSGLVETPAVIYCGGQGGDQGTRALVSNLYGAEFTNAAHTAYTINSDAGIRALETLRSMKEEGTLTVNTDIQAAEELNMFTAGKTAMTFAWNSSTAVNYGPKADFTVYPMTFPTDQTEPELCSGIWGFGLFKTGAPERIEAAKKLVRYLCDDETQGRESVRATNSSPARASFHDVYSGTPEEKDMLVYQQLLHYARDYNNITPGWAAQRTVWWNMLQQVFTGTDAREAADRYAQVANHAASGTVQSPVSTAASLVTKRVLFISSYSLSYPTVKEQIDGIREGLGTDVYLHNEFMDTSAISDEQYFAEFYQYISYKYSHIKGICAVIVGDDAALQLVLRYQNGFFRDIPVIYESVNSQTLKELADSLGMLGVSAHNTIEDNLDLACQMMPDADRILAITDESTAGKTRAAQLRAVKTRYGPRKVEIFDTAQHTAEEIAQEAEGAGSNTILLYMNFSRDSSGKAYPYQEALQLIVKHASTPVFTLAWMGEGSVGGVFSDAGETGKRAAELAENYLRGSTVTTGSAHTEEAPAIAGFDAAVLKAYHLSRRSLPSDAVYYNDTEYSTKLRYAIGALAVFALFLTLLLIRFKRENKLQKEKEDKLQQTSELLRTEAEMDGLTGLGNRRLFDRELKRGAEGSHSFALFLLDLDHFKQVNDTYGHQTGDLVLRETGSRLNSLKCRTFVPYRYGGDEFAVMFYFEKAMEVDDAETRIQNLFHTEIETDTGGIRMTISLGSADYPADAAGPEELIHCADRALYEVKEKGRDGAMRFCRVKDGEKEG